MAVCVNILLISSIGSKTSTEYALECEGITYSCQRTLVVKIEFLNGHNLRRGKILASRRKFVIFGFTATEIHDNLHGLIHTDCIDRRLVCLSCHLNFGWNDGEFLFLELFHFESVFCGLSPGLILF